MDPFEVLARTWPAAEERRIGPWTVRRGAGGGNRVSAATLEGAMDDIAPAESAVRAWGQVPLFMVRDGDAALDALLARCGYVRRDATVILAAPLRGFPAPEPGLAAIRCEAPLARMAEIWAAGGIGPARLAIMARAPGPKAWFLGRSGDRAAGAVFVACSGDAAMLHALEVAPEARRRGLGRQMTLACAAWARAQGARTLALAVTRENAPARALYAALGLAELGHYHYREAPPEGETR